MFEQAYEKVNVALFFLKDKETGELVPYLW